MLYEYESTTHIYRRDDHPLSVSRRDLLKTGAAAVVAGSAAAMIGQAPAAARPRAGASCRTA